MLARNISRWDAISASLGVSRRMGKKYRDSRIGFALDFLAWARATQKPDHRQNARAPRSFNGSLSSREENKTPGRDHGAVHDKPDDKLKVIKYQLPTRNQGGQKRGINVTLASAGAGVVQV